MPENDSHFYWRAAPSAAIVIALGFVAVGIPLQFYASWITLGWLTVFAGLWYCGHRQKNRTFVIMSYVFAAFGILRLLAEIAEQFSIESTRHVPVFNTVALPLLTSAIILTVAAVIANRYIPQKTGYEEIPIALGFNYLFGLLGYVFAGTVLSIEASHYFHAHSVWQPYSADYITFAFLTAFWFALAVVLLETGLFFRNEKIIGVAFAGLAFVVMRMFLADFPHRIEHLEPLNNPFSIGLIAESVVLMLLGLQRYLTKNIYREMLGIASIAGMFCLFGILTLDWFLFFRFDGCKIDPMYSLRSVTLFWTIYALVWIVAGFSLRNFPLRVCGLIFLFLAVIKTILPDSGTYDYGAWDWREYGLENRMALMNPYFLTMLCPVLPALFLAVWTNRIHPLPDKSERTAWKTAGLFGVFCLFVYLSVECYLYFKTAHSGFIALYSLTVFWTFVAAALVAVALYFCSTALRIVAASVLLISVLKVLLLDLINRPDYIIPFWNPYSLPMVLLAAAVIALSCLLVKRIDGDHSAERNVYRLFSFGGMIFLWFVMSAECFQSVRLLQGADQEAWKAQLALSILWSLFAGVLILIGFVWRSPVLRWLAISLFAATLAKILVIDMTGVDELYRFGAVFVLALFLALAAWAYQRFKPY